MKNFNNNIQSRFDEMQRTGKLFRVELSGQEIWNLYLGSFSKENNPIFRDPNSSYKNCNHCKNFVRRYGNIVSIGSNNEIVTMFDVDTNAEYQNTAKVLSNAIKGSKIKEVFVETFDELNSLPYESCSKSNIVFKLGIEKNTKIYNKEEALKYGVVKDGELRVFNHFHLIVQKQFIDTTGASAESLMAKYREDKNVFQRAMETISLDTLNLVKDLIIQGSLLNGDAHIHKIEKVIPLKEEYDKLAENQKDNWCWVNSFNFQYAKFRNELIGVLCTELAEGEELNKACLSWNKRVDPANYMKAVAPITEDQKRQARIFAEENGFLDSFNRRYANIDDIKVSEILHSNVGEGKIKSVSIFDSVKTPSTRHKRSEFDGVEEVSIEKFMKDILPTCSSVEAFVTNNHEGNFVSITTSINEDAKPMFKWNNNYSWTFNGNLAGKSEIKKAVKSAGGRVDGVLRFSLIWNDQQGFKDESDLDAWCVQPDNVRIGFNTEYRKDRGSKFSTCGGQLDLDNTHPNGKLAIENIYFSDIKKMKDGVYRFWVNQYSERNSQGFKAEIEIDGDIYLYEYNQPVSGNINVAEVTLKDGKFEIKHILPESALSSKEIYSIETNKFHKVNLVCLSPNHWGGNSVGNKHYFFMIDGCKSTKPIRGFHSENLLPELAEHRKVLETLGAVNMIEPADKQLSGLGFNATVKDELILKLQGTHKRVIKVKFK